jgi:hypothetical protein
MCSLQEAYEIPSFDTINKKKQRCVKDNVINGSNEFITTSGNEFAASWNKYGKEDFVNIPQYGEDSNTNDKKPKRYTSNNYIGTDSVSATSPYQGRANDVNFYCRETNI